jgi:DNA-binding response OmpR family regulator
MTKKILVIDNDPSICEIVQICLEHFSGWQVCTCNGSNALDTAIAGPWDAFIVEVAAGIDLVKQLQANPETQSVPIVLLTSRVTPREKARYRRLNVAGVVAKPFDSLNLGAEIAQLVGWSPSLTA